MSKIANITPPRKATNSSTRGSWDILSKKIVLGLVFALVVTSVAFAASFKCTPCPENYYCQKGIDYSCPDSKPITNGTGAKSEADCMTCAERDGESYPYFDNLSGDCKACWQISESTPYWNGSTCAVCPSGTEWDGTSCKESEPEVACAFTVPHNGGTLCLVESVDYTAYENISPKSAEEETDEFKAKYGIVNTASFYPDYWAGAMKYCQDKGLRLPTMYELTSIVNEVYGLSYTCQESCNMDEPPFHIINYQEEAPGCCDYDNLTIANEALFLFLGQTYVLSKAESPYEPVYARHFLDGISYSYFDHARTEKEHRTICIK